MKDNIIPFNTDIDIDKLKVDSEEEFFQMLDEIKKESCLKGPISYKLKTSLNKTLKDDLLSITSYYISLEDMNVNKSVIVEYLKDCLSDENLIKLMILNMDYFERELLINLLNDKYIIDNDLGYELYGFLYEIGFVYCYYLEENFIYVIPDEIKEGIRKVINDEDFQDEVQFVEVLEGFLEAAINLYGGISFNNLIHIYNHYFLKKEVEGFEEVKKIVKQYIEVLLTRERPYILYNDYIIDSSYEDSDIDEFIEDFVNKDLPYYIPDAITFYKYVDEEYYESNIHYERMKDFIKRELTEDEDLINTIIIMMRIESEIGSIDGVIQFFNINGIELNSGSQLEKFTKLYINFVNNTRMWCNHGFTPNEVSQMQIMKNKKIGRNDPCPCGSGKKYKYCCYK